MSERGARAVAVAGLLFVVLIVASIFVAPGTPNAHATAAKVVSYYQNHKGGVRVEAYVIGLAVFVGVFFFWYLRDWVCSVAENRQLATIGFAGALLFAASGALAAGIYWALADGVGHLDASAMQAFNVWQMDGVAFLLGVGQAVFLVGTGVAIARSGVLPRWLGWAGVVLGVIGLAVPAAVGPTPAGLWVLAASIALLIASPTSKRATIGDSGVRADS